MPVAIAKMLGSKMMSSAGKPTSPDQDAVGARADVDLALVSVGLALLVEGHHHRGGAVAAHQRGLALELGLAFLERNRVDDALALDALQAGLDDAPLRAVDHHRHARDLGFAGHQIEEAHHRRPAVEHRLVHVDVDDLGPVLDLLSRHREGFFELPGQDQPREGLRAGDVGALADVDEQRAGADRDGLEARQAQRRWSVGGSRGSHRRCIAGRTSAVAGCGRGGCIVAEPGGPWWPVATLLGRRGF